MTTWTPDEIREHDTRFLTAMKVEPLEQFDGGTERDCRDDFWLTWFCAVLIMCSIAVGLGTASAYMQHLDEAQQEAR